MTVLVTRDDRLLPEGVPPFRDDYIVTAGGQGSVALSGELSTTYELIYETNPNCAAVVNKLVRQIATLPIKVYDRPSSEDAPEEVRGHPVGKLLNKPAPRRGQSYWKQALARSALIHGNGLLAKYRGPSMAGSPQNLLAVAWPWVAAYAPLGSPVKWWSTFQTGTQRYFSVDDGVHLAWESQDLHGLGVSPLKPLAETIKLDDATRRYQASSFANGARPASAIVPPDGFAYQGNQREELRQEINRMHSGVDNAFKAALLAPGFKWEGLAHTAVEAEVIAARNLGREEFAMVYDVPPPMIGDLTHSTYSNVEELHRILYVTTLRPWFALIEEILQVQLIDGEEEWAGNDLYARFDLAEVLRGNRREEIDAASEAFVNGLATLNEAREMIDMPPVDKASDPEGLADMPHIPKNNLRPLIEPESPTDPNQVITGDPNETRPAPEKVTKATRVSPLHEDPSNL
ncbi:MAG TPA: phage portal protein [Solirubrobacteraceae bacterium]